MTDHDITLEMSIDSVDPDDVDPADILGSALKRRRDPHLMTGDAEYTDDIQYPQMAFMAVVRSQYGHARLEDVDTSAAEAADGVLDVYTHNDIAASDAPGLLAVWVDEDYATIPDRPILTDGRVRDQGEPIAVVVAEDRYTAAEATDLVEVSYDRLDAVTDPIEATDEGAPTVHHEAPGNTFISGQAMVSPSPFRDEHQSVAATTQARFRMRAMTSTADRIVRGTRCIRCRAGERALRASH